MKKLSELQTNIEKLENDLLIIYETSNAIETSLDSEMVSAKDMGWALIGVIRNIDNAVKDAGKIVQSVIDMRKVLD